MIKKSLLFLALALSLAAPVYSGGIVDRVFNGGTKSLAKQAVNLIKQAAATQPRPLTQPPPRIYLGRRIFGATPCNIFEKTPLRARLSGGSDIESAVIP